jgi:uncharacterized protein YraI
MISPPLRILPRMKTLQNILLSAALGLAVGSIASAQIPIRVIGERVNMRAKPRLNAEVVIQAQYDDQLTAYEIGEEWIEVTAPEAVNLWVSKKFVQTPQNTIGANRVNVRAGPSINYNIVDTLNLGDTVVPRGKEIQDWINIAPTPKARIWIHRDFVEILTELPPAAKTAKKSKKSSKTADFDEKTAQQDEKPASKAKKSSRRKKWTPEEKAEANDGVRENLVAALPTPIVSPSTPVEDTGSTSIPVPPPADLKLIPLEGQGRIIEVEGELRAAPLINEAPARYRVVIWQRNRWQILCHVYGRASKLRSLQDKKVWIKGRQYWIKDAAAPVLIPDQIREVSDDAQP